MLISEYRDCSTAGVRGLDLQLIAEMNRLQPGVLSRFSNTLTSLGGGAHDWLQTRASEALKRAIFKRNRPMQINSAYRTVAQQFVLRNHYENGRCGITAAADVGMSNHNGALAIDIEDHEGWGSYLEAEGWDWIGSFDQMHFDYRGGGTIDIRPLSVKAFQSLWNLNFPDDEIAMDGIWGPGTRVRLLKTSVSGFNQVNVDPVDDGGKSGNDAMREGDTGEGVKRLQSALRARQFDIEVDGVFGPSTTVVVKLFQARNGIGVDGVVGVMTLKELGLS
jgi:hypothetical protein